MNANMATNGSLFFRQCVSVYALCATLAFPAAGQDSGKPGNPDDAKTVAVSDYGTVDISVKDTDLATVLEMLSLESKKNIITSKTVSATVSANLYGVTLHEALQAILDVNGYTYYEQGNFIYVITKQEADEIAKARRSTESRIFPLNYLSATDANEFIQPLLSEVGKASARGAVQPGMKPEVSNNGADDYAFAPRLVVNDFPENLDAIATLLRELDTPPQQVLVEATILQTALNEDNAFGVDFTVIGSLNFTDLTSPLAAVNNLLSGKDSAKGFQPPDNKAQAASTNVGNTSAPGGLKIGVISDDISVFLRVLDEVTDTTVLARPKVMALNRQRAEVHVGTKVGYLSTTSTETTTTQNVQFLDTGVQLIFRPFISTDGMIRLELKPSVSDFRLRDVTDSTGNSVTIPDELTNQVLTNVRVKDGQTLVLGGLFKERFQTTRRQVPLLGDVPLLGAAFRGQDDTVNRSEIIFLITPSIVRDSTLWAMGEDQLNDVHRLRVGARAQLLPFSREKVTANYNQKAQDAYDRGDHKKALYYINSSLGLAPNQAEMIHLREQITGERARSHERSLMERAARRGLGLPAQPAVEAEANTAPVASPEEAAVPAENNSEPVEAVNAESAEQVTSAETTEVPTEPEFFDAAVPDAGTEGSGTGVAPVPDDGMSEMPVEESPEFVDGEPWDSASTSESNPWSQEMTPELQEWLRANLQTSETSTDANPSTESDSITMGSEESAPESRTSSITDEQWLVYQQFLFEYFMMLDLPELAASFACEDWNSEGVTSVATVTEAPGSNAR